MSAPSLGTRISHQQHHKRRLSLQHHIFNPNCSTSTLFIGCAIASLLCLTLQVRIYYKTVNEHGQQHVHLSSPDTMSKSSFTATVERLKNRSLKNSHHPKYELFALDTQEDRDNSNIVLQQEEGDEQPEEANNNKNDDNKSDGDETNPQKSRPFHPRVVTFHVPSNVEIPLKRPSALLLDPDEDDSNKEDHKVGSQSLPENDDVQQTHKDALENNDNEIDDETETGEQPLENKQGIHDSSSSNNENQEDECVPMGKWQTSKPINCNALHEIDLLTSIIHAEKKKGKSKTPPKLRSPADTTTSSSLPHYHHHKPLQHPDWNDSQLQLLGQGWFRAAWKLDRQPPDREDPQEDETLILKMLRPERDFTEEFYELHRRDAVAMEQLTHSKFVLNIYGYCGQSALNEYANFRIPELSSLEKFDRQLRGKKSPQLNHMKLKLAVSVASGLADAHELPADIAGDNRASMVHYDLNPRNVAIVKGAMPKLNDFNTARFLKYNPKTNETCGAEANLHEPWWRAPEEVWLNKTNPVVDEKADIYALGNILFHILTTHSPRGKLKAYRMEEVRQDVLKGIHPHLPSEYTESNDPAIVAFRKAMDMCFQMNPKDRSSAREVSNVVLDALLALDH